jgi:hypothetical protein
VSVGHSLYVHINPDGTSVLVVKAQDINGKITWFTTPVTEVKVPPQ